MSSTNIPDFDACICLGGCEENMLTALMKKSGSSDRDIATTARRIIYEWDVP